MKFLQNKNLLVLFFSIITIISIPFFYASALDIGIQDSDINFSITPASPEPYQNVSIKLTSYATDLNKATINWQAGSRVLLSGIGKTEYSFKTSGPNIATVLDVIINASEGGDPITKRFVITPSEIDMLWESVDGYTPPFYKGKAFVSREGIIRVVAIPTGGLNDVTYDWKNNNSSVQEVSGYNKNSYTFKNEAIKLKESISVSVSSVNSQYNASGSINIPIIDPKIIFYKKSPTEGIFYNNSLGKEVTMPKTEDKMTIVAEPYFMTLKSNSDLFTYSWQVNGNDIETPIEKTQLTVTPTSRGGQATVSLSIDNLNLLFQSAIAQLKINL